MNFHKLKKISKISYVVFNFLVLLTMFLPSISIDKYVEYDFSNGYYNESYQSYTTPIASKITPIKIMSVLFGDITDAIICRTEYNELKNKLDKQLNNGEISLNEYNNTLSSADETNLYYPLCIHFGLTSDFSRLEGKIFLYAIVLLIFYCLTALLLVLNLVNIFNEKKLISITNIFGAWALTVIYLVFNIYSFSLALSSDNIIEGVSGTIKEISTTCFGPKFLAILTMILLFCFAIYVTIFEKFESKIIKQNKEIPIIVSQNINQQNRYRKINSKKSKYKNGSKKKRHR